MRKHRQGPRYRPLIRALKLFVALSRSRFGLTMTELIEEGGCSRRTIYRYLDALEESGVRISAQLNSITGQMLRRVEHVDGRRLNVVA